MLNCLGEDLDGMILLMICQGCYQKAGQGYQCQDTYDSQPGYFKWKIKKFTSKNYCFLPTYAPLGAFLFPNLRVLDLSCASHLHITTTYAFTTSPQVDLHRAANNSRSSDNGRPKFANVRQNRNLGRTFCPANFLLQHLTISFTNII